VIAPPSASIQVSPAIMAPVRLDLVPVDGAPAITILKPL
jgi:hypothetical protein